MVSAKHDRKYSCAYCSVPPDTAHRRQHSREKIQMMLFAAKSLKNRQGQARVCSTCKRHRSKFVERCAGRKADWASFFLPKYTPLGFSKEKKNFLSSSSPPFISALSLTERALHRMFFQNESQAHFWVTSYSFAPHSAVQVCSFCWLLYKGMTSPEHPGLHWEKLFLHLLCGCWRICRPKGTGAG